MQNRDRASFTPICIIVRMTDRLGDIVYAKNERISHTSPLSSFFLNVEKHMPKPH